MSQRTSPIQVLFRTFATIFSGLLLIAGILVIGGVQSTPLTPLSLLLVTAMSVTSIYHGFMWLGCRVAFSALFGETQKYKEFRESGGDPWFSYGSWPFNTDSEQVRMTGNDEPEIRWFCNHCAAEAIDLEAPCRVCGWEQWKCGRCGTPIRTNGAPCSRCDSPLDQRGRSGRNLKDC
ncbi:MAG TPA: hypothetical protein PLY87_04915 [Planctomycetaceae bacterium]|nr:hypothetical protein [Planctomycetaceae bacterium]